MRQVIIAGGTGYLGQGLGEKLLAAGYREQLPLLATFVHLVGTPHPAPWKNDKFRAVDLVALEQSVEAGSAISSAHFVFVSVAHPAPLMKAYIAVRMEREKILRESKLNATILRPWYILGPGHRWPYALIPIYNVLEAIPSLRERAGRPLCKRCRREEKASAFETAEIRSARPLQ